MMKRLVCTSALLGCLFLVGGISAAQDKKPNVSAAEGDAIQKINKAKDAPAKLDVAAEFVRKFPQSAYRAEVAKYVAQQIEGVTDVPQRITLNEKFLTIFNTPAERALVAETLVADYILAERTSDAYKLGNESIEAHPDMIDLKRMLAVAATNESIKGNDSFIKQGREYAAKAIAQIEADTKPADMDAQQWTEYKTKYLVALYREAGVLAVRGGDPAGARGSLEKAVALKSTDPIVYFFLSSLTNDEYLTRAKQNKAMPEGAQKAADMVQVQQLLDHVIELFAQTLAIAEGNAQFADASKVMRGDLETYYGFRHGSTAGVQALIDKYKKP